MCAYCLVRPFKVLEHFLPVAVAGTTVKNCIPACYKCNQNKRDYAGDQLVELFGADTIARIQNYLESREAMTPDHPVKFKAQKPVLQDKDTFKVSELIECLPYRMTEFGRKYDISEVTIARLRDGKPGLRGTINKLLAALSDVYGKTFTMRNVRGIIIRGETQNGDEPIEAAT